MTKGGLLPQYELLLWAETFRVVGMGRNSLQKVALLLALRMHEIDFDLSDFGSIARIEEVETQPVVLSGLPNPHPLAAALLQKFSGKKLVPHGIDSGEEYDLHFSTHAAVEIEEEILKLSSILQEDLCPIAGAAEHSGVVLLSRCGEVYAVSVNAVDVYFLGDLKQAIPILLKGKPMTPVLPKRDYPQEHHDEEYYPGSEGVIWIDTPEWIIEKDPEVLEKRAALWRQCFGIPDN